MKSYHINQLVMLGKRDQEAAEFVRHCSSTPIGRDIALAHLRHVYGHGRVYMSLRQGEDDTIVVAGLFTASPIESQSPFRTQSTFDHNRA